VKHILNREVRLDEAEVRERPDAKQADPAKAAERDDDWNDLLRGLKLLYDHVMRRLGCGESVHDIADECALSEKTVRRIIDRVRAKHADRGDR
jgi:DNA-binding NarL/FixJ family response regulator